MTTLLLLAPQSIVPSLVFVGLVLLSVLVVRVTQVCWNNLSASVDGMHRIGFFQAVCLVVGTGCLAALPIALLFWMGAIL